ncbi:MAG TPA: acetyl-CoA acetyltransferase [Candidatus Binatia bacterium]|jgi:acetyl-CoA C-acetyltransferase
MNERVAIIGVGMTAARPATEHLSFKEMMFEAAQRAYADAGVEAHQIESFVTCAEDLCEGISIFDEYTPDQLGAAQKPMHTLTQDGLNGIADAVMQLRSGLVGMVVVEAHSKHSNLEKPDSILDYALDPVYNRPLGFNPHVIAGLEMNIFLHARGITQAQCAQVVAKNRTQALKNIAAAYPMNLRVDDVESSPYLCYPLREAEMAKGADGCVVMVLASESRAKQTQSRPIWVRGVGFANDSPTLESRDWIDAQSIHRAALMAYRQAGIKDPASEIDFFEVDDSYAYKELQHLVGLGIYPQAEGAGRAIESGETGAAGKTPVNVSGGSLGIGHTLEASGLYRLAEVVFQLRGEAGSRQLEKTKIGLAQSWRGVPTTSGAVVILAVD